MHGHSSLFPTARPGQRLLLGFLVAERFVVPSRGQSSRSRERRSRWCVELGRMVHLDHLGRIEVRSRDVGQVHHQHGADGEVWGDDPTQSLALARGLELVHRVRGQPGGAHHGRCPGRDSRERVVQSFGRLREVDECSRPLLAEELGQVVAQLDTADVLDAGFGLKSGGEDRADLAAVTGDRDSNRLSHLL